MDAIFESGFCATRVNSCDVPTLVSMKYSLQTGFSSSDYASEENRYQFRRFGTRSLMRAAFLFRSDWIYATVYSLLI